MSEVRELLERLAAGEISLGAVAADFVQRKWVPDRAPSDDYETEAARELDDARFIPAGSWLEVEAAYTAGLISDDVYRVLYQAMTGDVDGPAGGEAEGTGRP